jgi:ribose transport system ATP-binding protein
MIELELTGITKIYPGAVAVDRVDLAIRGGEVVGLIGENGAGKSTLMKVLGGAIAADAGQIIVDGVAHDSLTPARATALGIAFVHQELNPFTNLDVAGNVLLGREIRRGPLGAMDRAAMSRRVAAILAPLATRFGPDDPVLGLSLADQQMMEIAKALSMNARLVILDEPTSSLTLSETHRLLEVIGDLKRQGVAVLFITHRLSEIEGVADRVVGLRDGRNAGGLAKNEINHDRMVHLMIGRDVTRLFQRQNHVAGAPVLEARGIRTTAFPERPVDLTLRCGEIHGLAGLVGAGRTELARVLFGVDPAHGGVLALDGVEVTNHTVAGAIAAGICLVPEDRKRQGLLLEFAISDNIALPSLARLSSRGRLNNRAEAELAETSRDRLRIKAANLNRAAAELSGGNQQKVVLAKWLAMDPKVLIFDEPTRGIDVGSKAEVYGLMQDLADRGVAILMISSDMEEVIGISDRVSVMSRGRIAGTLEREELSEEAILRLAVE